MTLLYLAFIPKFGSGRILLRNVKPFDLTPISPAISLAVRCKRRHGGSASFPVLQNGPTVTT